MPQGKRPTSKRTAEEIDATPAKKCKFDFGPVVKIGVGQPLRYFTVHVNRLRDQSEFFRDELADIKFLTTTQTLEYPSKSVNSFRVYLSWIYEPTKSLSIPAEEIEVELGSIDDSDSDRHRRVEICKRLIKVWMFADHLLDVGCKNTIIDVLIREKFHEVITKNKEIYDKTYETSENSTLRKWLIRSTLVSLKRANFDRMLDKMPEEMAFDVFRAYFAMKGPVGEANRPKEGDAAFQE